MNQPGTRRFDGGLAVVATFSSAGRAILKQVPVHESGNRSENKGRVVSETLWIDPPHFVELMIGQPKRA